MLKQISQSAQQYLIITGNYWAFTLTDGALRMLVLLHFHQLGYSPLEVALLFLFYEFFGVVTNFVGGWLGARFGLNRIMNIGLGLQIAALSMLLVPAESLTVIWVMMAQALSGIAKDLNKMSAKSSIKFLISDDQPGRLFHWVAFLTGSKNTLKGIGFFLGGLLLNTLGFQQAILSMALALGVVWLFSLCCLKRDLGRSSNKKKFSQMFSTSSSVNLLSAARLFLFCSRDVWFVVALPVYLSQSLNWDFWKIGGFLALWIIGYGAVQALAPKITRQVTRRTSSLWSAVLSIVPALIASALVLNIPPEICLLNGLILFGILFAINSSLHSYLIVSYAKADGASMDIGFYYTANAAGRLIGTILSGWVFQAWGLEACLWLSSCLLVMATLISLLLNGQPAPSSNSTNH